MPPAIPTGDRWVVVVLRFNHGDTQDENGYWFVIGVGHRHRLSVAGHSPTGTALVGALLVLSMTVGYILMDRFAWHRASQSRSLCGGPTGELPSRGKRP